MAVLTDTARARVLAQLMREATTEWAGVTKPDLSAAVAACDNWVEANIASLNSALPQPFRGAASTAQKVMLLSFVLWRRVGRLRAEEDDPTQPVGI